MNLFISYFIIFGFSKVSNTSLFNLFSLVVKVNPLFKSCMFAELILSFFVAA